MFVTVKQPLQILVKVKYDIIKEGNHNSILWTRSKNSYASTRTEFIMKYIIELQVGYTRVIFHWQIHMTTKVCFQNDYCGVSSEFCYRYKRSILNVFLLITDIIKKYL